MMTKQKKQRQIATFFLLIFFPTCFPTSLFAANSGPAAPEATSFEPVDAKDMVNLMSGDMTYVLPLLNVPSPEGGYPLALSNHAGIAMDQEASWVGLGWSLNPGAINRSVAGIPDDWKRANTNTIFYDAGGEIKSYFASVSVGFGKGIYSVGLSGSYSENKTFGGSTTYSSDVAVEFGTKGFGGSIGTNGASLGYQIGVGQTSLGASFGISQSFEDGSTAASAGLKASGGKNYVGPSNTSIGLSLSSKNGLRGAVGGQQFRLSGSTLPPGSSNFTGEGLTLPIQIYNVNITLGFGKGRYWQYDNTYTTYDGSLYPGDQYNLWANDSNLHVLTAFDSYNSTYKLNSYEQTKEANLSFVSYDNYSVSGQGISGTFKPAIFEQGSLINNYYKKSETEAISYSSGSGNSFTKNVNNSANDIHFYFDNENSSYLRLTSGNWDTANIPVLNINNTTSFNTMTPLNNQQLLSDTTIDGVVKNGYNSSTKRKRTGSFIETFTNQEIISAGSANIINPETSYNRSAAPASGIGAFRITAIDGKVYHYSIPVYQREQFTKSTDIASDFENRYLENVQLVPYATHWLLTAITGPDYVDTNSNNKVDEADYGYWVSFDYGKWSDGFVWQTPVKSNDKVKAFEWGVKEIYYLDKIKTRTHTALFVKEAKDDDAAQTVSTGSSATSPACNEKRNLAPVTGKDGNKYFFGALGTTVQMMGVNDVANAKYCRYVSCGNHKTLKLSKILLLKNQDLAAAPVIKNSGASPASSFQGRILLKEMVEVTHGSTVYDYENPPYDRTWYGQFYDNVYDIADISYALQPKILKTIVFNYNGDVVLAKNAPHTTAPSNGRLTLNSIDFLGRNSVKAIPPYKFGYDNGDYDSNQEDNWGYKKSAPWVWSLNKITTPTGANINILYESDDVEKEAVSGRRVFDAGLQFTFVQNANGTLRINATNETGTAINFEDYFQTGWTYCDLWASRKHDYYDWECKTKKGSVDIKTNILVTSVTPAQVVLEASWLSTYDENSGLSYLFGNPVGLNVHPGTILENADRGEFGDPPGCAGNPVDRLVLIYQLFQNKLTLPASSKNGGGIRVKEINITDGATLTGSTRYYYNVPGYDENKYDPNYKSSGITSYVPQKYFKEIKYKTELPSPGVMYESVTVKSFSATNELGLVEEYNFEVLKPDNSTVDSDLIIPGALEIQKTQNYTNPTYTLSNGAVINLNLCKFNIKDMTANLGRLKQKRTLNSLQQVLSQQRYSYKDLSNIKQGIYEESFNTYKNASNSPTFNYSSVITSKSVYPSILESTTVTEGSYTNTSYVDAYDFLTGEATEMHNIKNDGLSTKTKTIAAYQKYPLMGSKSDNISNKNMLSQSAANYSYILDNSIWKVTGVGLTTWENDWTYKTLSGDTEPTITDAEAMIWRKHKNFIWKGTADADGIYASYDNTNGNDDNFDWNLGIGTNWRAISEATLYNHFSLLLESDDVNGNSQSVKMGDNNSKVMAVGNAGYNEIFYSGAEYTQNSPYLDAEVKISNATWNSTYFHTGKNSVSTTSSSQFGVLMRDTQHTTGKYKLSVWVEKNNAANAQLLVNNVNTPFISDNPAIRAGNWELKTAIIAVPAGQCTIYLNSANATTVYYDDLMIRPVIAGITGYVYDEWDELTYIIGNNGLATRFEYDNAGRLMKTYIEVIDDTANSIVGGFKLVSSKRINYKNL